MIPAFKESDRFALLGRRAGASLFVAPPLSLHAQRAQSSNSTTFSLIIARDSAQGLMSPPSCVAPGMCCAPNAGIRPTAVSHVAPETLRKYLSHVYAAAEISKYSDAILRQLFLSRQWFYAAAGARLPVALLTALPLITPERYTCDDGFFGSGLLQRDAPSSFPTILPCVPGSDCVRRQAAHMPSCAAEMRAAGDRGGVWFEVWRMAFDGRHRPFAHPQGWADFLDHGCARDIGFMQSLASQPLT